MRVQFEPVGHVYRIDGVIVPSVTQVLDPEQDFSMVPADVLEAARAFGSHGHIAAALLVRGQLDWATLDPALVLPLEGVRNFLEDSKVVVLTCEQVVASKALRVAGTLDLRCRWKRALALIDWKFAWTIPYTVGLQTAAYDELYRGMYGGPKHKRYCVLLGRQFRRYYKVQELDDPCDWNHFKALLVGHHWRQGVRRKAA